jgi:hypothetical protein
MLKPDSTHLGSICRLARMPRSGRGDHHPGHAAIKTLAEGQPHRDPCAPDGRQHKVTGPSARCAPAW